MSMACPCRIQAVSGHHRFGVDGKERERGGLAGRRKEKEKRRRRRVYQAPKLATAKAVSSRQ